MLDLLLDRRFTAYLIVFIVGITILFDIYLAWGDRIPNNTISKVLQQWAHGNMVIAWFWAVLAGHLFWANSAPLFGAHNSIYILVGITVLIAVIGAFVSERPSILFVVLIAGVFVGHYLWPQKPITIL